MAVNKQFSGNVVGENATALSNIRYSGYHVNSDTWSSWYDTNNETQYNINLGDADWLTQDGVVAVGDIILLVFETLETVVTDRIFSLLKIVIDTSDYYINDVQLLPTHTPTIQNKWYLESVIDGNDTMYIENIDKDVYIGRINEPIIAYSSPDTMYTWYYNGVLHYQLETYYNQDIFKDRIAISSIEYDFGNGYGVSNNYTYDIISPTPPEYNDVNIRVTNVAGLLDIDTLSIQIRYNEPAISFTWDPYKPTVNDTLTIQNTTEDTDNTIVNIDYLFDNNIITSNQDINYSWIQDLLDSYVPSHSVTYNATWSDGFNNNNTITVSNNIYMTNIPPTINLEIEKVTNTTYIFKPTNINDPDGDNNLVNTKWILEYYNTLSGSYDIVYVRDYSDNITQDPLELDITTIGEYRMSIYGKDSYGLVGSNSELFTILAEECNDNSGSISLIPGSDILISIPIIDGRVYKDFILKIDDMIKIYDNTKTVGDIISYVSRYDTNSNKYLTYIPNFTNVNSHHNFKLTDGVDNIYGLYISIKDYAHITNDILTFNWSQG